MPEFTFRHFLYLCSMNGQAKVPSGFHGIVKWQSPSNIALVKYWGKKGVQLPQNPSISFTLSQCRTETSVTFEAAENFSLRFYFEGNENQAFAAKIEKFLLDHVADFPWLNRMSLNMESSNTFPHSSGIASSASSMSALVLCLLDIDRMLKGEAEIDLQKASCLARIASGSASRSVFPMMALWGKTDALATSSDEYAVSLENQINPIFKTYCDSILIVSDAAKSVSSRAGHSLMENNPYAAARYSQANRNIENLLAALRNGDLETFIEITESEAMQLHALMMCSTPSFILMKPNTLNIISEIRRFRETTQIPLCFTLDAGPNVHLLYPKQYADAAETFINENLVRYCTDSKWIKDCVGNGPKKII